MLFLLDSQGVSPIADSAEYRFVVDDPGSRLDKLVAETCPEVTRTRAQKLIAAGLVTVNGAAARASLKLNAGDRVAVSVPRQPSPDPQAEDIPLGVLYEDEDLLVIDKPAGLPVHPAPGHPAHTLVNAVLNRVSQLPDAGDPARPGIVHRLDMDTSGVMLIAKSQSAQSSLSEQFKARSVAKTYLTLVRGRLTPERGVIEAPIERDPGNRKRMAVAPEGRGRPSLTRYRLVRYVGNRSFLEVRPETGRTHQIRVHLAAIGHPVLGDAVYGAPPYGAPSDEVPRLFLHACRLGFRLPSTGEHVEFESSLPPDLEGALARLT